MIYKKNEHNIYALKNKMIPKPKHSVHNAQGIRGHMSSDYTRVSLSSRGRTRYEKQGFPKYLPTPIIFLPSIVTTRSSTGSGSISSIVKEFGFSIAIYLLLPVLSLRPISNTSLHLH